MWSVQKKTNRKEGGERERNLIMKNTMISMIYGAILVIMFVLAYLIAAGLFLPENTLMVAAIVVALLSVIALDFKLNKPRRNINFALN